MDEVIWVEVLSRQREVTARHRCAGPMVLIGRGYGNDIVLDDPHVAPQHLRIVRDETGALVAEDTGSVSGLFAADSKKRATHIILDGDRTLRIGRTLLRVREAAHAVAPERVAQRQARIWPCLLGLSLALLGVEALSQWLNETTEPKLSRYLVPLVTISALAVGWAGLWALFTRILSGQARFERNLLIALSGLLALSLYDEFVKLTAFALSWRALTTYQYVEVWCVVALVCFFHLRQLGRSRLRLAGGIVAALCVIAIALQTLTLTEAHFAGGQQDYVRRLMPPALRLSPLRSETAFIAEIEQLKTKLDSARKEAPSGGGIGAIFETDD